MSIGSTTIDVLHICVTWLLTSVAVVLIDILLFIAIVATCITIFTWFFNLIVICYEFTRRDGKIKSGEV